MLDDSQLQQYRDDGYLIIDIGLSEDVTDGVVSDLSPYWGKNRIQPKGVSYADGNRIQDAWKISENVKNLCINPLILKALKQLYKKKPLPFQTLNFEMGTEQRTHADSIHFNTEPFGFMCGVWIALEDIGPEQGPVKYYPGTNKLPEINYEDAGVVAHSSHYPEYENHIENIVKEHDFQPMHALLQKGQALIWSANLLHGGSRQLDKTLTRRSQVTHYYFDETQYWRPSLSQNGRHYFVPGWIPYTENRDWFGGFNRKKQQLINRILNKL